MEDIVRNKSWKLEDAQAIADEFPYTFYKPSREVVSMLRPGNEVKLIFRFESDDPETPGAERMWVEITEIHENGFSGYLDIEPVYIYIKDLKYRDPVRFQDRHII